MSNEQFSHLVKGGSDIDVDIAKGGLDMVGAMAVLNIGSWETFAAKVEDQSVSSKL